MDKQGDRTISSSVSLFYMKVLGSGQGSVFLHRSCLLKVQILPSPGIKKQPTPKSIGCLFGRVFITCQYKTRKKLVATASRRERVYKRTDKPSVTFCEKGEARKRADDFFA